MGRRHHNQPMGAGMGKLTKKRKLTPRKYKMALDRRRKTREMKRQRDIEKFGFARGFRDSGAI